MAVIESNAYLEAQSVRLEFPFNSRGDGPIMPIGGEIVKAGKGNRLIAVNDVSFKLGAGDSLGLLGHNGSGKTTLLRLLAGIYLPSSGRVLSRGVMGNALNTNLGFRQEATGRRNIVLKALVAGYKRSDIDMLIDNVEDFAELGPFLDQPLYTYSAGMRARLTFGVATAMPSDILILDEWLGAGDSRMQEKAAERMNAFIEQAFITVLASHSSQLLNRVCTKGLVMEHGKPKYIGPIGSALLFYDELSGKK